MQSTPRVEGCAPPSDPFIADVIAPDGTRETNYDGTLKEAFQCIGLLGTEGCGFEQGLESMRRALETVGPVQQNAGFLRDDANLAIIFLTDEDDCSARDPRVFSHMPGSDDVLGPLASFRCTEFGVLCDDGTISRGEATYSTCEPRGDSYLHHPDAYAEFLKELEGGESNKIFVGVIAGDADGLAVSLSEIDSRPEVQPSCESANGVAIPSHRLTYFAEPETGPEAGGCQSTSGSGGFWLLSLAALALSSRRRRRSQR